MASDEDAPRVEISSEQAHSMVEAGATLVDVRTAEEYEEGHIDGAINVPVDEIDQRMSAIPSDEPVVVYCGSGRRAARARATLEAQDYDVHSLGAMSNW